MIRKLATIATTTLLALGAFVATADASCATGWGGPKHRATSVCR